MTFSINKLCSSIVALFLISSGGALTLSSCVKDAEEPVMEKPGNDKPENDDPVEKPNDDPEDDPNENPGNDPEIDNPDEENPGDEIEIPEMFSDPMTYVILPSNTPVQVKDYTGFTVNFNKDNHTPNYVAWELTKSETSGSANRNDYDFWQDNDLEGCPTRDYAYSTSGYERGHMCPAADQKWSAQAMRDCMVMSNMCPQLPDINGKAWATLESKERDWAKRDGAIWIIAGPIYDDSDQQRIGFSQVRVPSAFFKVFLYNKGDESRSIAFVYPNALAPGNMSEYAMSVDDLEKELGYDFFPALPDEIENKIEATYDFNLWNK